MATGDPKTIGTGPASIPPAGPRRFRWTKKEFYRLDRLGFFRDRGVELIGGEIMLLATTPPHCISVSLISDATRAAFGAGFCIRQRQALDVGARHLLLPDIAVVPGGPRDYATHHPTTALLVVEVGESTLRYDRIRKMPIYARARVADYWVVNLIDRQLEVHRSPQPDPIHKDRFRYAEVTIVPADGFATPLAAPGARVAVADLLP
jgi:hypothetical protein